jgi:hypothetical protein
MGRESETMICEKCQRDDLTFSWSKRGFKCKECA